MLKKMILTAIMIACTAGVTMAFDADIKGDLSIDYSSKYIWRGKAISDESVMQTGLDFKIDNIKVGIWGNMDITNDLEERNNFTKVDYYIEYGDKLGDMMKYCIGAKRFDFDIDNSNYVMGTPMATTEVYAGLGMDMMLNPMIKAYYDVDEAQDGMNIRGCVSESMELSDGIGLDCSASVGWTNDKSNEVYWGSDDDAFQDFKANVGMPIAMGDWTLTPNVTYVALLDSDMREADGFYASDDPDYFYAGVGLSTSF
ncbi:hypothetical protein [Sedimentisphaera salicampi]|uniref:Uncharacterized protein n=1 Tax=Sedimentisphaera salicampi TaxID=1941349 RepID=A0A1W6LKW4_9BACT|nr:hypothetical protein [Sedimentisphaera salicampi]ARN56409.1 hypothetical protein STSP1_00790 [Sedimentisphaera salicampi]OXU15295.1 hypothetical protein SMSP1_00774 [Sedimentisphaera salicampi]